MRNGRLIFALSLFAGALWAVPAGASHKILVGAAQLPAFSGGDCAITAGSVVISCATLAGKPIGTTGATIPLLNGTNTWSATQTFSATLVMSGNNLISLNGVSFAFNNGSFNVVYDEAGNQTLLLGAGNNYYNQNAHIFRNSPGSVIYGGFDTSGFWYTNLAEQHAISTVTASFTYDATVHNVVAGSRATALTAAVVATLPQCVAAIKGRTYGLKKADNSANNVTLTAATTNAQTGTADLIDGAATVALSAQYAQVNVECDGAGNWWRGFY